MQDRLTWAQAACARILRPLVRLALSMGLKHAQLDQLLRELLVDEARRLWREQGTAKPNISQLSMTTGLHRKDVTARVRRVEEGLPHTEQSAAAKTFTWWLQLATDEPACRRLPIVATGAELSFERIARQASRGNVHHRAVLDELIRLGMVGEADGQVDLQADAFVPSGDLQSSLAFLGDNTRDHLAAAVSNTLGVAQPRFLERSVYATGVTHTACEAIHQLARQRWDGLHHELVRDMNLAVDETQGEGAWRIKVGIYVYHEEMDARPPAPAAPTGT